MWVSDDCFAFSFWNALNFRGVLFLLFCVFMLELWLREVIVYRFGFCTGYLLGVLYGTTAVHLTLGFWEAFLTPECYFGLPLILQHLVMGFVLVKHHKWSKRHIPDRS